MSIKKISILVIKESKSRELFFSFKEKSPFIKKGLKELRRRKTLKGRN
jgi:hypothetical protein